MYLNVFLNVGRGLVLVRFRCVQVLRMHVVLRTGPPLMQDSR